MARIDFIRSYLVYRATNHFAMVAYQDVLKICIGPA